MEATNPTTLETSMITIIILCVIASLIVCMAVGTVLRKGGAAADDPPGKPAAPVDQDAAP